MNRIEQIMARAGGDPLKVAGLTDRLRFLADSFAFLTAERDAEGRQRIYVFSEEARTERDRIQREAERTLRDFIAAESQQLLTDARAAIATDPAKAAVLVAGSNELLDCLAGLRSETPPAVMYANVFGEPLPLPATP